MIRSGVVERQASRWAVKVLRRGEVLAEAAARGHVDVPAGSSPAPAARVQGRGVDEVLVFVDRPRSTSGTGSNVA